MKKVEIIIGANYGDEGKGLLTRHFSLNAIHNNEKAIVVFSQGTAQRGHTVDYNPKFRHIYHHFGSGTGDGLPTYFADTFWIHPMEFAREYAELAQVGIHPVVYCHPDAPVITPFDMLVDHVTMAWIAKQRGEREHGTCGLGSWCAIESKGREQAYTISDFATNDIQVLHYIMEDTWNKCLAILIQRGVNVEELPEYKEYFEPNSWRKERLISNFIGDIQFFLLHSSLVKFDLIYDAFEHIIFENGQGLGLDMDVDNDWHTTSKTGIINPLIMLNDKEDFNAEVCYVTRSYLTRHGIGPLEEAVKKEEINSEMHDLTNVPNEFQGTLRYGYLEDKEQAKRIATDWALVEHDKRFKKEMAITHCNEFEDLYQKAKYCSFNPFTVLNRE